MLNFPSNVVFLWNFPLHGVTFYTSASLSSVSIVVDLNSSKIVPLNPQTYNLESWKWHIGPRGYGPWLAAELTHHCTRLMELIASIEIDFEKNYAKWRTPPSTYDSQYNSNTHYPQSPQISLQPCWRAPQMTSPFPRTKSHRLSRPKSKIGFKIGPTC